MFHSSIKSRRFFNDSLYFSPHFHLRSHFLQTYGDNFGPYIASILSNKSTKLLNLIHPRRYSIAKSALHKSDRVTDYKHFALNPLTRQKMPTTFVSVVRKQPLMKGSCIWQVENSRKNAQEGKNNSNIRRCVQIMSFFSFCFSCFELNLEILHPTLYSQNLYQAQRLLSGQVFLGKSIVLDKGEGLMCSRELEICLLSLL